MSTTIEQYREAKNQYLKLKNQARKELIARFNALASELLQVQRELLEDFGEKVTLPTKPTAVKKPKASGAAASAAAASAGQPAAATAAAPNSANTAKASALNRQLQQQKKKLEDLKAAGKPTKAVEDRIYEIEDELRLLQ